MSPLYRNHETGKTQFHPKSGLGETFNAEEIDATGHPVKPRVPLGTSKQGVSDARKAQKPTGKTTKTVAEPAKKTTGESAGDTNNQKDA